MPYEIVLYYECERHHCLPFSGALLDQPHILFLCFRIIEDEAAQAEAERHKIAEINHKNMETFKAKNNE